MLRRSILALSHQRLSIRRASRHDSTQKFLCTRREFSSARHQNFSPGSGPPNKPPEQGRNVSKFLVGSIAIGTCFFVAYSTGYLDDIFGKRRQSSTDPLDFRSDNLSAEKQPNGGRGSHDSENINGSELVHAVEDLKSLGSDVEDSKESSEKQSIVDPFEESHKTVGDGEHTAKSSPHLKPGEEYTVTKKEELPNNSDATHVKEAELLKSSPPKETNQDENLILPKFESNGGSEVQNRIEQEEAGEQLPTTDEADAIFQQKKREENIPVGLKSEDEAKDLENLDLEPSTSLLDAYSLGDKVDEGVSTSNEHVVKPASVREEFSGHENKGGAYESSDGKLIMDFLQAIHSAEQRQAELDARIFTEEKRAIKEKYEKEVKDARARELMYAEEVAMLEKEVKKERAKAAAALKSLQEKLELRLKMELEEKDRETESKLKEVKDFAKVELAASIAREKAAQIEKMAEADLNINALCMAFYARSEEARQTHSVHKLALGALALEDALANGLPIQGELDALNVCIDGVDKDSLLELAISSLPEDVRLHGTDSPLRLHQKFDALKGTLRHFSLIPPNGGGILAHSLALVASFLKVKESDQSGDGIESLINKVESLLTQGKLVEAANTLEDGVKGSKAAEVVNDWLWKARNRAIAEQALVLLHSYATSISVS